MMRKQEHPMKPYISLIASALLTATPAFAQNSSAVVTGAVDAQKNRTSATEAKEDTKTGNKQAVSPANAASAAAQQQPDKPNQPKPPGDSKPH
jgi:hypothetical protein